MKNNSLYIVDGYALIYKSYYGFGKQDPLRNSRQENVTAILTFFRSLFSLIKNHNIEALVVALDPKEPSFRKKQYSEYKANRPEVPDELRQQSNRIEALLQCAGIQTLRIADNEADDIIASLACQRDNQGLSTVIISGDKDLMQLINDRITMLRFTTKREFKSGVEPFGKEDVLTKMGVIPSQIHDYLAIVGDTSDNIPGVNGIGAKGAIKLLEKHHSLFKIYEEIHRVTPAGIHDKLLKNKENALLSWELVKLKRDIALPSLESEAYSLYQVKFTHLMEELAKLEIKQILKDVLSLAQQFENHATPYIEAESIPQKLPLTYQVLTTQEEVENLFNQLKTAKIFAYDSETTGLNPHHDVIVGMSFSMQAHHGYYLPFQAPTGEATLKWHTTLPLLRDLFATEGLQILGQNLKFDMQFLYQHNIILKPYFDTMIAAWLIDSESRVNLDTLAHHYLQHQTIHYSDIVAKNQQFQDVSLSVSAQYASEDASLVYLLYPILDNLLRELDLQNLFYSLEMPLVTILAKMEWRGITINIEELKNWGLELQKKLSLHEKKIMELAGQEFNLQSPKQLAEILFSKMKFPNLKKGSTDIGILQELHRLHPNEPIITEIIEFRKFAKLNSTYIEGLLKEVDETASIHTSFLQTGTASGRLSSTNPNLQNIPIKDDFGRIIRRAFKARRGYKFISADYSQIELVVLAHLASDPIMLEIFANNRDLHRETASFLFQKPMEHITSEERRIGKTINFGVIYGMSAFRLSNELKIPRHLASQFIESYFTRYAGVSRFIDKIVSHAQERKEVRTILQRRRIIHQINSSNFKERSASERVALNTVIQGSAADIVKLAMIKLDGFLAEKKIDAHLLLQVHDELILEVEEDQVDLTKELLSKAMIEAGFSLPLPMRLSINMEIGDTWGEFH